MKTGLVVIDMLNDFQDGALANPAAEDIVGPLKKLIKAARANNDWVVIYGNCIAPISRDTKVSDG